MKGDRLPVGSHVVRYASPTRAEIPGSAFIRSARDCDGLSVNWVECFPGSTEEQIQRIRELFRLTLRKNGRFLRVDVDDVVKHLLEHAPDLSIAVIEDPLEAVTESELSWDADPSHALVQGLPQDPDSPEAEYVGDLIAQRIIDPTYTGIVE